MRPPFAAALRNPISRIGVALTTASAFLFLILLTLQGFGFLENPYIGILVFVLVPALFLVGLLIIPVGLWLERRRTRAGIAAPAWPRIDLNDPAQRRALLFVCACGGSIMTHVALPVSFVVVALSLSAAMSTGCMHLPPSAYARAREAKYFSENREVLPSIRSAIERGHVVLGMDREQVWTVLGEPVRRTTFTRERAIEIWLYRGHKLHQDQMRADSASLFRAVFRDGILVILEPL